MIHNSFARVATFTNIVYDKVVKKILFLFLLPILLLFSGFKNYSFASFDCVYTYNSPLIEGEGVQFDLTVNSNGQLAENTETSYRIRLSGAGIVPSTNRLGYSQFPVTTDANGNVHYTATVNLYPGSITAQIVDYSAVVQCNPQTNTVQPTDPTINFNRVDPPCGGDCSVISTAIGEISTRPEGFVQKVLGLILSLSGGILVIILIIAGYRLMTSQGDPEKIKAAREQVTSALIGLLFIIFSFVIYQFITSEVLRLPGFN